MKELAKELLLEIIQIIERKPTTTDYFDNALEKMVS